MTSRIERSLEERGLVLPNAAAPAANYVPWTVSGKLLFVSGQLPLADGRLVATGKLGAEVDLETGQACAWASALNVLAQARAGCGGDLDRLVRIVKVVGFVASTAAFTEHHKVVNGASDLFAAAMGEGGRHARSAVGCVSLPLDTPVEIEAIFELG